MVCADIQRRSERTLAVDDRDDIRAAWVRASIPTVKVDRVNLCSVSAALEFWTLSALEL